MIDARKAALTSIEDWLSAAAPESDMSRREKMAIKPTVGESNSAKVKKIHVETGHFDFANLADGYDTAVDWVIKKYLPANAFGVIYGASESFKSFHAISWAASIAAGREWNGVRCTKAPVLYVAAEGGVGASRRAKGWQMAYNGDSEVSNLFAIKVPVFIGSADQVALLVNTIRQIERRAGEKVSTVFLDTLARCFGGADENKTADMNLFVAGCDKIKAETGATVVVVHHTGKNKERDARGSSALRAACDFEYCIDRPDKGMLYVLRCTKVKDSEPPKTEAFQMDTRLLFVDDEGDEVTTLVASSEGEEPPAAVESASVQPLNLTGGQEAVLQAIRYRNTTGEATTRQVILDDFKARGFAQKHYGRTLNQLIEKELVLQAGDTLTLA